MDRSAQARRGSANNLRLGLAAVRPLNAARCGGKAAAHAAPIKEACTKTWPRQVFTRLNRGFQSAPTTPPCLPAIRARSDSRIFGILGARRVCPIVNGSFSSERRSSRATPLRAAPADAAHHIPRLRALVAELLEVKEPIVKKRRHPHAGRDLATARKAARSSQCLPCQEGATPRHVSERRTADRRRTRALWLPEEARVVDAVRARSTR